MNAESFVFSSRSGIILYGASSIGHLMFEKLSSAGYKIAGFIDKRAEEIKEYMGVPVWTVSSVPKEIKAGDDTVVFVAVKNVFEHQTIAALLTENGFHNIIYKPYNSIINNSSDYDRKMSAVYEQVFDGKLDGEILVDATLQIAGSYDTDYGISQKENGYVTALIPVDFIYTNDYRNTEMEKWGNINILAFFTHLRFYGFLQGDMEAGYSDYLNEYCIYTAMLDGKIKITEDWKSNVLHNRAQIYDEMCRALMMDHEFFFRVPPQAVWNERGYFNLTSGKHRATFLAAKGQYLIPLQVTERDYTVFLNMDVFKAAQKYLAKGYRGNGYVPHPYCYRISGISYTYYGLISAIVRVLAERSYKENGRIRFDKLTILEDTGDNGVLGAFFARMGSRVLRYCGTGDKELPQFIWTLGHVAGEIEEIGILDRHANADVLITDVTDGSLGREAIGQIPFRDCFVICREEGQAVQLAGKCHKENIRKMFHTFREGGISLLYWLY